VSDFHAIGGVSASLQALLRDRMEVPTEVPGGQFEVTVGPPQGPAANNQDAEPPRVNLFLYRITENGCLKNQETPGHGHPAAYGHPPLSLDLHYLLTAYGTTDDNGQMNETISHFLLGSAMRVLHDHPVIHEGLVTGGGQSILHASLRGEFERVKVSLEPLSIEDLSKVWTALTLPYRISAAYMVNVVQIESRRQRRFPRPVGEPPLAGPRVIVVPMKAPRIAEVRVRRPGDPPALERRFAFARINDVLILRGGEMSAGVDGEVRVFLGEVDASAGILSLRPDRLEVTVPDHPDLQPGAVQVAVRVGTPELPQTGFRSNEAVFMLVPRNDLITPNLGATPRRLLIQGERLFLGRATGETLIGEDAVPKGDYLAAVPTSITVPVPDTLPAWPVDCLVSGDLAPFPGLVDPLDMGVTIGGDGPHLATLPFTPGNLQDAAVAVERGVRQAPGGGTAFRGTRVAALVAGNRLAVVPGGLRGAVNVAASAMADALKLSTGTAVRAFLSGRLAPFPTLTVNPPRLRMTIGADVRTVTLAAVPTNLAEAANLLEAALRAAGPPASFADARVGVLGEQLLIVPGVAAPAPAIIRFDPEPGVDETTYALLQLRASYAVRARVSGAEDLDNRTVELP
jgi:hypothetical protein